MNAEEMARVRADMGEPVVVGSYPGPMEADIACARLEAEGIHAAVLDDQVVMMDPLATYALGGVKIMVAAKDAAAASAILTVKKDPPPPFLCPECDSEDVARGRRWTFLSLVFLGFPIGPAKPKHSCNDCGHIWRE